MTRTSTVLISALTVVVLGSMAGADTIVLSGPDQTDDMTMASNEWKIWGSHTGLYAGYKDGATTYRTVMKFDVAGAPELSGLGGAQIDSATMRIFVGLASSGNLPSQTFDLHRLRRPFDESDFINGQIESGKTTWNCAALDPTIEYWGAGGADSTTEDRYATVDASFTGPASTSKDWISIDVTQYVKDVVDGADDYGWLIKGTDESAGDTRHILWESSEDDAGYAPQLEISYVPEPAGMLLVLGGLAMGWVRRSGK